MDARNYRASVQKAIRDGVFNANTTRTIEDGVREFMNLAESGRIKHMENNLYFNVRHIGELKQNGQFA